MSPSNISGETFQIFLMTPITQKSRIIRHQWSGKHVSVVSKHFLIVRRYKKFSKFISTNLTSLKKFFVKARPDIWSHKLQSAFHPSQEKGKILGNERALFFLTFTRDRYFTAGKWQRARATVTATIYFLI